MDEDEAFRRAMAEAGVVPLAAGKDTVERGPARRRQGGPAPRQPLAPGGFSLERYGEQVEALAPGGDRRQLRRLKRGDLPVERTLDLHGDTEESARRAVEDAVERLADAGLRCLLVIHGRGHRSPGAPVLKEALPGWLTGPRCANRVMAFCTATPELGGPGATLVLLRPPPRRGR